MTGIKERTNAGYWRYWGKSDAETYHPLACHCLDVAAVGELLLERDAGLTTSLSSLLGWQSETTRSVLPTLLAVHDLGKFHPTFQSLRADLVVTLGRENSRRAYDVRHDARGEEFWRGGVFEDLFREGHVRAGPEQAQLEARQALDVLMAPLFGHHGAPARTESYKRPRPPKLELQDAVDFARDWFKLRGGIDVTLSAGDGPRLASWLIAGWAVLSDWVGSNAVWFPYDPAQSSLETYWGYARERAVHAVGQAGVSPRGFKCRAQIAELFPFLRDAVLSPAQQFAEAFEAPEEPSLLILEDLTGSGKTEAALTLTQRFLAAGRADGVYLALPTMATANAMHDRVASIAERFFSDSKDAHESVVLAHSATYLKSILDHEIRGDDDYDSAEDSVSTLARGWLFDSRKKALLAPIGVGTIDQALLAGLPARHSTLRLLGLHRKVLIVDEVHAYDAYTAELLLRLLAFHRALGGHAILLSATLPASLKRKLSALYADVQIEAFGSAFPAVSIACGGALRVHPQACRPGTERSQRVRFVESVEDVVDALVRTAQDRGCACWIRNTIGDAIEAVQWLQDAGVRATLFHARYVLGERLALEREVLQCVGKQSNETTRAGTVVVATQVVEQSVDVDFDTLVTDLAPIDLIIQRAGRLRRHPRDAVGNPSPKDRRGPCELLVFAPPWDSSPRAPWLSGPHMKTRFVYPDLGELWRTQQILVERGALRLPDDARALVEHVYGPNASEELPAGIREASEREQGTELAHRSLAQFNALSPQAGYTVERGQWLPDTVTPTRLGEPTTTLRLVDRDTGEPIFRHPKIGWSLSEVRARGVLSNTSEDTALAEALAASMPDAGRYCVTLPMLRSEDGLWTGQARTDEGKNLHFTYSALGLQWTTQ